MAVVSKTRTYSSGDILTAQFYNEDRDEIIAGANSITDAQVSGTAGIQLTKLANGTMPVGIQITADNFPSAVTLTGSQTVTNKVFTKPIMQGSSQLVTIDVDGAIVTFDLASSNVHTVVLGGNRTLTVSNVVVGQPFIIRLTQDVFGSRTVNWWTTIKWPGGLAPSLITTPNSTDVFGFICTATDGIGGYTFDGYYVAFDVR
jgi:hypothetical protein